MPAMLQPLPSFIVPMARVVKVETDVKAKDFEAPSESSMICFARPLYAAIERVFTIFIMEIMGGENLVANRKLVCHTVLLAPFSDFCKRFLKSCRSRLILARVSPAVLNLRVRSIG